MTNFEKMPYIEQVQAMTIICNIQMIQEKIHGKHFSFSDFADNSLNELWSLQDIAIKDWNNYLKSK
mgnify:CR=1 FL=1